MKKKSTTTKKKSEKKHSSNKKQNMLLIDTPTFYSMKDMCQKPLTANYLRNMAINAIKLVESDEDILTMNRVFNMLGVLKKTWYRWAEKNEDVKNASTWIRQLVADRRETGALKRKLDASTVNAMMPYYDDDWKAIVEWRAGLRNDNPDIQDRKIVIQMEKFED